MIYIVLKPISFQNFIYQNDYMTGYGGNSEISRNAYNNASHC